MGISRKLECSSSSPTCFAWKSSTQNYHLERSTKVLRTVSAYFGALWITKSGAWSQKPVKHTHVQTASKTYLRPTKMYPEHIRKRPTGTHYATSIWDYLHLFGPTDQYEHQEWIKPAVQSSSPETSHICSAVPSCQLERVPKAFSGSSCTAKARARLKTFQPSNKKSNTYSVNYIK